jgi:hypothetical protein
VLGCNRRTSDALVTHVPILGQVLERAALGLGNEQRSEDTREHERGEDLHDVVEPRGGVGGGGVAANTERRDGTLRDDGTNLAGTGGETVGGGAVARGKALAGNNESSGVGAPWKSLVSVCVDDVMMRLTVEEQLDEDVDSQHGVAGKVLVGETPDAVSG